MPRETISSSHLNSIEQLDGQLDWSDFTITAPNGSEITNESFVLVAIGNPDRENEKWNMDVIDEQYSKRQDLIYALVVGGKLLKLGKSITTMKERIGSYHSGKDNYRQKQKATNSATNWFILQSVLAIGLPVYVYAFYIPQTMGEFMGWTFHNRVSKEIEGLMISAFYDKYKFKPIGNKQR